MSKFILFTVALVVLVLSVHADEALQNLDSTSSTSKPNDDSSSSEEFDLTKLTPDETKELREWAKTVNLTWEQIGALSDFQKEIKGVKDKSQKTASVQKLCKKFDTESEIVGNEQNKRARELAAVGQTIRLLTLFQELQAEENEDDARKVFVILKEVCHISNILEATLETV